MVARLAYAQPLPSQGHGPLARLASYAQGRPMVGVLDPVIELLVELLDDHSRTAAFLK